MGVVVKLTSQPGEGGLARGSTDILQQMAQDSEYRRHRNLAMFEHVPNVPADGIGRRYGDFVGMMREARKLQGLSHLALDCHIQELLAEEGMGRRWQDGYTGKLERPDSCYGKAAVNPSFDLWLMGLGMGFKFVPLR